MKFDVKKLLLYVSLGAILFSVLRFGLNVILAYSYCRGGAC